MQQNSLTFQSSSQLQTNDESENYTLIEINKKVCALKTSDVLEITKIMELEYPNKMPSCVLGIIKYEQTPLALLDIREVFKRERIVYDLSAKIVVIETNTTKTSIICDRVLDIKKLSKNKIHKLPYQSDTNFYDGIYINNEENIYLLNIDKICQYIEQHPEKYENTEPASNYIVSDDEAKKILKERKNFLIKDIQDVQNNTPLFDRGVSFLINGVKYYINMASIKEFYKVNNSKFIKVPNTPDFIFGLVNIKGDYITVLDIRRFYSNPKTTIKEKSTIIILNSQEYKIGILADEICESINVDFEEILQKRIQTQEDGKMSEFVKDNEIYQVVDIEKLFQDDRLTIA